MISSSLAACTNNGFSPLNSVTGTNTSASAGATPVPVSSGYKLVEDISGSGFFSHFNFETFADPTHGYVTYVDKATATQQGLINYNATTGRVKVSVDSTTIAGAGRSSVRLSSTAAYNSGLFIIDVNHMPEGLGAWPAFWSFGPNWPGSGEIDIIEGVNNASKNASTLHTKSGCNMASVNAPATMTGRYIASTDCNDNNGYNGCPTEGAADSFGPGFNSSGGGVYAALWNSVGIKVWFFKRGQIPSDISAGNPDPSKWGLPVSNFEFGVACPANYFANHNIILNTTFCGDWAGAVYSGANGSGNAACIDYVKNNPTAFANAYWDINFIRAYSVP